MSEELIPLISVTIHEEILMLVKDYEDAAILSKMIFWASCCRKDGWFYKTAKELSEHLLIIPRSTVDRKLKQLAQKGYFEIEKRSEILYDKTNYYKVNLDKINKDLEEIGYRLRDFTKKKEEKKMPKEDDLTKLQIKMGELKYPLNKNTIKLLKEDKLFTDMLHHFSKTRTKLEERKSKGESLAKCIVVFINQEKRLPTMPELDTIDDTLGKGYYPSTFKNALKVLKFESLDESKDELLKAIEKAKIDAIPKASMPQTQTKNPKTVDVFSEYNTSLLD